MHVASANPLGRMWERAKDHGARVGGMAVGGFEQTVNSLANTVPVPIYHRGQLTWSQGDVFTPTGQHERQGAQLARSAMSLVGLPPLPIGAPIRRDDRALLGSTLLNAPADGATSTLRFTAAARGNDWGNKGQESAIVSVFVGDSYHSDVTVLSERPDLYEVNLGSLPAGEHRLELRSATDIAPPNAQPAVVDNIQAHANSGDQALFNRYAPVFESRVLGLAPKRSSAGHTDTPLLLVPSLTENPTGTRTIDYHVMFSNEDGGSDTETLFRHYGRGVDYEKAYSVTIDDQGRKLDESYQGPRHKLLPFTGSHQGERPQLRVATSNNVFSDQLRGAGPRWSPAASAPAERGHTSFDTMVRNPWTFAVMAKELAREERSLLDGPPPRGKVGDPRTYLYVAGQGDAIRDALEGGDAVQLRLDDGSNVGMRLEDASRNPAEAAALPLPRRAVADAVVGVEQLVGRAFVLGTDYVPRRLASGLQGAAQKARDMATAAI